MHITLIDSSDLKQPVSERVASFLNEHFNTWYFRVKEKRNPPAEYYEDPDFDTTTRLKSFESVSCMSNTIRIERWDDIFDRMEEYDDNEEESKSFHILYTAERNENNWFSAFDPKGKAKAFVQANYWDELVDSNDPIYPVIYETVAVILQWRMFRTIKATMANVHKNPIGCINDFCGKKEQVILKLQTANICDKCYQKALDEGLEEQELDEVDIVLDEIRKEFRTFNRKRKQRKPEKVTLPEYGNRIYIGKKELKMRPLEKTLYAFFLQQEDPLGRVDLEQHVKTLYDLYGRYSKRMRVEPEELKAAMVKLARNEDGIIDQSVSRINSAIRSLVIKDHYEHFALITNKAMGHMKINAEHIIK